MKLFTFDNHPRYKHYAAWAVFLLYFLVLFVSTLHHELWGDEVHSWNIAKASETLMDLISNSRYEGHPPLWYVFLFSLSKFTHNPLSMQYLQLCICLLNAFLLLFHCRLSLFYKALVLFGYYFIYEYGVFSRNYSIAIFFSFLICSFSQSDFKNKSFLHFGLLFLLSNTHFLGVLMAISFHVYFLLISFNSQSRKKIWLHGAVGFIILLPALYFIFPPSSSSLNTGFWLKIWSRDQLFLMVYAPLRALAAVPSWWDYHFWNTHVLLAAQKSYTFLKYLTPIISLGLCGGVIYVLYPNKKVLIFFLLNLFLTLGFAFIFPLTSARYLGFIFLSFILALFLSQGATIQSYTRHCVLSFILLLHLVGSFIASAKDFKHPFSQAYEIKKISKMVPENGVIITDYWCLNYLSAFLDKPFYCLGFNKEKSFLLWDEEMSKVTVRKDIYTRGTSLYFKRNKRDEVYFITNTPKQDIVKRDSAFFNTFSINLIKAEDNAIEKYSNIYLYRIRLIE